ncbi:MAG: hypothetical protein ABIH66_00565 [bacterium]
MKKFAFFLLIVFFVSSFQSRPVRADNDSGAAVAAGVVILAIILSSNRHKHEVMDDYYDVGELEPANGRTVTTVYETFKWPMFTDDKGHIGSYYVQISQDEYFEDYREIHCSVTVVGNEFIPADYDNCNLKYGRTYYWRVTSSEYKWFKYSPVSEFTLVYDRPEPIFPRRGEELYSQQPEFRFTIVEDTVAYELQIAEDSAFSRIVETVKDEIPEIFHLDARRFSEIRAAGNDRLMDTDDDFEFVELTDILSVLKANSVYYWRVRAIYYDMVAFKDSRLVEIGKSQWSTKNSFSIPSQPTWENLQTMEQITKSKEYDELNPEISPNGELLIYEKHQRRGIFGYFRKREIWMRNFFQKSHGTAAGEGEMPIVESIAGSGNLSPEWYPSSMRIAFTTNSLEKEWEWDIVEKDLDTKGKRLVTDNREPNFHVKVSYDGNFIAYDERNDDGQWFIWTVQKENMVRTQIAMGRQPALSPDGERIVYVRDGPLANSEIWIIGVDGSKNTKITTADWFEHHLFPQWSPTRGIIAFESNESGNYDLWLVSEDGSKKTQLTTYLGHDITPSWSPDGEYLVFSSTRNGDEYDLWFGKVPDDILDETAMYIEYEESDEGEMEYEEVKPKKKPEVEYETIEPVYPWQK